jgi:hypothetical protein
MTDYKPQRRVGSNIESRPNFVGPPEAAKPIIKPDIENPSLDETGKRRRRASVGGHALKLAAPTRPGFVRRFFNDSGNRIAQAEQLGYTAVEAPQSPGLGSHDERLVGTQASGAPLKAILMETPDELYAEGVAEKEAHNRQIDEAIVAGRDSTGQLPSNDAAHGSIKSDR